jgi:hypothetical protein
MLLQTGWTGLKSIYAVVASQVETVARTQASEHQCFDWKRGCFTSHYHWSFIAHAERGANVGVVPPVQTSLSLQAHSAAQRSAA